MVSSCPPCALNMPHDRFDGLSDICNSLRIGFESLYRLRVRITCTSAAEHTGSYGNENHEKRSLGVPIANRSGHRGEPLVRIAIILILDDLVEMEGHADDKGAQECSCNPNEQAASQQG